MQIIVHTPCRIGGEHVEPGTYPVTAQEAEELRGVSAHIEVVEDEPEDAEVAPIDPAQ